jgi:hypothetical protein
MPAVRQMTFEVRKDKAPLQVLINGKRMKKSSSEVSHKYTYFFKDGWLKIHFSWKGEPVHIEIIK